MQKLVRAKFRVKIKSLAEEARIIRHEEKLCLGRDSHRGVLRHHRITVVRNEQRATLLALAFLRGIPYAKIESPNSRTVDVKRVRQIVGSLGWPYGWLISLDGTDEYRTADIASWLAASSCPQE